MPEKISQYTLDFYQQKKWSQFTGSLQPTCRKILAALNDQQMSVDDISRLTLLGKPTISTTTTAMVTKGIIYKPKRKVFVVFDPDLAKYLKTLDLAEILEVTLEKIENAQNLQVQDLSLRVLKPTAILFPNKINVDHQNLELQKRINQTIHSFLAELEIIEN